jgi:membrane-associated phospholipid phosphatase
MKSQIRRQRHIPGKFLGQVLRKNLLLILIPGLMWIFALSARDALIQRRCLNSEQACIAASVMPFDRFALGQENTLADQYSYLTQNLAGVVALAAPALYHGTLFILKKTPLLGTWIAISQDLVILSQGIVWNGLLTELSHLISQRPRPFVYSDPLMRGVSASHYTSFYSGHTSFTALATTLTFLILLARKAPVGILILGAASAEVLTFSTAYFRIWAGRHFFSDVVCGALAGSFVAWILFRYHKKSGLLMSLKNDEQ